MVYATAAVILSVLAFIASCPQAYAQDPKDQVAHWFQLARDNADMADADTKDTVMLGLAELKLMDGKMAEFQALIGEVTDQERAQKQLPVLAYKLTRRGHKDLADRLLAECSKKGDERDRSKYLRWIGIALAEQHEFAKASEVGHAITDPVQLNGFLESLARSQAEAGQWQEARSTANRVKLKPVEGAEGWDESVTELRALIADCEKKRIARRPKPANTGSAAAEYRSVVQLFSTEPNSDALPSAIRRAESSDSPEPQSDAWIAVAWHHIVHQDIESARSSLHKARAAAKAIHDPLPRSWRLVLIADAYLEIGDHATARECATETSELKDDIAPIVRGITNFTTGPVIVGVLVRIGDTQRALQALLSAQNEDVSSAWIAFGQFCAESEQLAFVKEHFERLPHPSAKAYVALGVAAGLM